MYVYEHILAKHYGWDLEQIRSLDLQDFYTHVRICLIHEDVDREIQIKMAGGTVGSRIPADEEKHVTQVKRHKSGAVTKTESSRHVGKKTVGKMKFDKRGRVVSYDQPPLE